MNLLMISALALALQTPAPVVYCTASDAGISGENAAGTHDRTLLSPVAYYATAASTPGDCMKAAVDKCRTKSTHPNDCGSAE